MRFQTTKAEIINARHNLPISIFARKQSNLIKTPSFGNLSSLFQRLFRIIANEEKNSTSENETSLIEFVGFVPETNENESRSLQELENCANAARETEACGQYEWIKQSDE